MEIRHAMGEKSFEPRKTRQVVQTRANYTPVSFSIRTDTNKCTSLRLTLQMKINAGPCARESRTKSQVQLQYFRVVTCSRFGPHIIINVFAVYMDSIVIEISVRNMTVSMYATSSR